jgi:hypothetical protein
MKLLKISLILGCLSTLANSATITVSAGFGTQGIVVTTNGTTSVPSFFVAVGNYSSGVFTPFGGVTDTAKVSGVITSTSPTSLNSQVINLFVGSGNSIASSTNYLILSPNAGTTFPSDVTQATGVTYAATLGVNQTLVTSSGATWSGNTTLGGGAGAGMITFVPEPSAALLGAVGALGLLRRRRI